MHLYFSKLRSDTFHLLFPFTHSSPHNTSGVTLVQRCCWVKHNLKDLVYWEATWLGFFIPLLL